jgi:hypothetical protein
VADEIPWTQESEPLGVALPYFEPAIPNATIESMTVELSQCTANRCEDRFDVTLRLSVAAPCEAKLRLPYWGHIAREDDFYGWPGEIVASLDGKEVGARWRFPNSKERGMGTFGHAVPIAPGWRADGVIDFPIAFSQPGSHTIKLVALDPDQGASTATSWFAIAPAEAHGLRAKRLEIITRTSDAAARFLLPRSAKPPVCDAKGCRLSLGERDRWPSIAAVEWHH